MGGLFAEKIGRAHGIENELLRHGLHKAVDGLPSRAVGGHDHGRTDRLHRLHRRLDGGFAGAA
jgi:hypothetical protein